MGRPRVSRKAGRAFSSNTRRCPPDASALAESLWMGKLDGVAVRQFKQHCESCSECARISAREREVIRMIRAALAEQPPELMTTFAPIICVTRWPEFTENVQSQIARNQCEPVRLRIPAGKEKLANGLLTFRWFRYEVAGEKN